jgi:hypothetical protein
LDEGKDGREEPKPKTCQNRREEGIGMETRREAVLAVSRWKGGGEGQGVREDRALGHEYACPWGGGSNGLDSNMIRSWIGGKYHEEEY